MIVRKEDRPKIILLVVLLVVAIGFVLRTVLSSMSSSSGPTVAQAAPPAPVPAATGTAPTNVVVGPGTGPVVMNYSELPSPNEGNPFRNVLPDPNKLNATHPEVPPKPATSVRPMPGLGGGNGILPPMGTGLNGGATVAVVPKTITLNGIVSGRFLGALVSVGDATELISVGKDFEGFRLAALTAQAAVFTTRVGRFTLRVGDSRTAPIG